MSFYCKECGLQSMNEPFSEDLCNKCWKKLKKAPTQEEIKQEMELYNADEVVLKNPITIEEAEYNLLNSDKYHYKNKPIKLQFSGFGNDPVKCNNCGWRGTEQNLYTLEQDEEKEFCPQCDKAGCIDENPKNWTVWAGGVEVNNNYLSFEEAEELLKDYIEKGYKDVSIEERK